MSIERIRRDDSATGVSILQLTSFPLTHWLTGPAGDGITPDGRTLLLSENSDATRDAPRDLYRVNSDGAGLERLARGVSGGVTDVRGTSAYAGRGGSILRLPLDGGGEQEIAREPNWTDVHVSARSPDGRHVFGAGQRGDRTFDVFRLDLREGRLRTICRASYLMPVQVHGAAGDRIVSSIAPIDENGEPRMSWGYWSFTFDGEQFEQIPFARSTNHYVPRGGSDEVVTTVNHPGNALDVAAPGDRAARTLAHGPCFWHVTADASGEWIVGDTNWPDIGLQLVHAPSGRFRTLCGTGASGGHPQWTHAHPCLAPNGGYVVFASDRTGFAQVYLCPIPVELKERLRRGA